MTKKEEKGTEQTATTSGETKVQWNTQNLKSSYANVCTVTMTREEVVLNFGVNNAWERSRGEVEIELTDRIILSPFAALRMLDSLTKLMQEYQARYGKLQEMSTPVPQAPAPDTQQ